MSIIEKAFLAGRSKQAWFMFQREHLEYFTRKDLIPFYADLIRSKPSDDEIMCINSKILSKFSSSGLNYIKERAWKLVGKRIQL